jgi:hypothetical protein
MVSNGQAQPGDDLLTQLPGSPDAYPQKIDLVREAALLVLFDENVYRSASFLDDRVLGPATKGAWVPLGRLAEAARSVKNPRPLHFIFHTGHVGSTLLSRLLDETGVVLSLREPLPLRSLAEAFDVLNHADSLLSKAQFEFVVRMLMRMWSRGYEATRTVVLKATSSTGRLAATVLSVSQQSRAVYMNLRAEPYLATLLAGENSALDLRGHGPERMRRLQSRITSELPPLHAMSIGELAALSWLAETRTQRETLEHFADRVIALDFDEFLSGVAAGVERVSGHFGLPHDAAYLSRVGQSPVLTRYSKAPEYAYTPSVRAEVLRDSRRANREEIHRGLAWLERLARSDNVIAAVVSGAGF